MIALVAAAWAGETPLVATGSTWKYLDTGVDPGPTWVDPTFDDAAWATGQAPLGYGIAGVVTTVSYGANPLSRYVTTWFRQSFTATDLGDYEAFAVELRRDDGAVVYLNGVEVYRTNLPTGTIGASTLATASVYGADQDTFLDVVLPNDALVEGTNVVAVEVHQQSVSSSDLVMDLGVSAWDGPTAVTRGPWIQRTTADGALVRWRTDGPSASRVSWGPSPINLLFQADDPTIAFDHEVAVTGVAPATVVSYAVGTPSGLVLAGANPAHEFRTAPAPGTPGPTRVWVLGDSGTANASAEAVRDQYAALYPDPLDTDVWLMLGDNAYGSGTEAEYDEAVFDFYPEWLRQVALWPSLGNHDGYSAFSDTQTGPYFELFTLPTQGEAGGEPSGTEAYWSFDHGNIHFVDLDSYHSDRAPGSPMLAWLEADLAASTADWTIAFFHHPPYSKGSHDSDSETEMVEMREHVVPILETHGVDLVLTGHSHDYERSFLLDGHYEDSDTFDLATMALQDHDGDPQGGGAYTKWTANDGPHQGAVYVVAGSSGQVSGGSLDHPAMVVSLNVLGSLVLDVDGLELEGTFLDSLGAVGDRFAIHKGVTTIVELDGDTLGREGELLSFEGLAYEPDGTEPPTYTWDWDDGTPTTAGAAATHAWAAEGAYTVTLSVTDSTGAVTSDTLLVNIDNGPPEIDATGTSASPVEGSPVTFTASASDPGGDPVTYAWEIDGWAYDGAAVDHTFDDDGSYEASLTVTDDAGRTATAIVPVEVANAPPTIDGYVAGTVPIVEGAEVTLTALVGDPGWADTVTTTWTIDGTEQVGTSVAWLFPASGNVPATIRATDDDGGVAALDVVIEVENAPPVLVDPTWDGDLVEGGVVTFSARAVDPGVDDDPTVTWDFVDGSPRVVGEVVAHVFPDQGPWEVVVAAEDGEGGYQFAILDVLLENVPAAIDVLLAPSAADEGVPQEFRVLAQDPGVGDEISVHWAFGDGTSADGTPARHAFPDEGRYLVEVDVTDDEGEGESQVTEVVVRNVAPAFSSFPDPLRVEPGAEFRYTPVVVDPDPIAFSLVGPEGTRLDPDGTVRWRAPRDVGAVAGFALTADDGDGGVTTQAWSLVVAGDSAAPEDRLDRVDARACGCAAGGGSGWGIVLLVAFRRRQPRSMSGRTPLRRSTSATNAATSAASAVQNSSSGYPMASPRRSRCTVVPAAFAAAHAPAASAATTKRTISAPPGPSSRRRQP